MMNGNGLQRPLTSDAFTQEDTYRLTRMPVEAALSLIPEAYTSPEFYALEQARVFGNSWVAVGLAAQVRQPGDVLVAELASQSIIVTRNKGGELRAFYNVCRHRGTMMLASDCTAVKNGRIRCPYHSWAYDLDGLCLGTPLFEGSDIPPDQQRIFDMGGAAKFDRADYPLFPVHVTEWACLVFIHLGECPPPLTDQLGDLPARLAPYQLHDWEIAGARDYSFKANYKLVGENFMEYYHLPWVHPELIKVSRMEDHYRWQGPGLYTGMTTWPISQGEDGGWLGLPPFDALKDQLRESARFIWLFPNVAINVMPNHCFIMLMKPDGPDRTVEKTWLLAHPESLAAEGAEAELKQLAGFWDLVNTQDIDIVERVQAGLKMNPYRGGRLCYHFEEPLHRFQNMIIDKMVGLDRIPPGDAEPQIPMFAS